MSPGYSRVLLIALLLPTGWPSNVSTATEDDPSSCPKQMTPDTFFYGPGRGSNEWFRWWNVRHNGIMGLVVTVNDDGPVRGKHPKEAEALTPKNSAYAYEQMYTVRRTGWTLVPLAEAKKMRRWMVQQQGTILRQVRPSMFPCPLRPPEASDSFLHIAVAGVETLLDYQARNDRIPINWFLMIGRELIRLRDAKQLDFHGNLKPENIVIKGSKLTLLFPAFRTMNPDGSMTMTTSPTFNPLIATGEKADLMAIGIIFYSIITGRTPFEGTPIGTGPISRTNRMVEEAQMLLKIKSARQRRIDNNDPMPAEELPLSDIVDDCITNPDYTLEKLVAALTAFLQSDSGPPTPQKPTQPTLPTAPAAAPVANGVARAAPTATTTVPATAATAVTASTESTPQAAFLRTAFLGLWSRVRAVVTEVLDSIDD